MYLRFLSSTEFGTPLELAFSIDFDGLIININCTSNHLALNEESFQLCTNQFSMDAAIWYKCEMFDSVSIDFSARTLSAALSDGIYLASCPTNSLNPQHTVIASTKRVQMHDTDYSCVITLATTIFEQFSNHQGNYGSNEFESVVELLHVYLLPALRIGINSDDRELLLNYRSLFASRITELEKDLIVQTELLDHTKSDVCGALADLLGALQEAQSVERFSTPLLLSLFGSLQNEIARMTQSVWGQLESDESFSPTSEAARNQISQLLIARENIKFHLENERRVRVAVQTDRTKTALLENLLGSRARTPDEQLLQSRCKDYLRHMEEASDLRSRRAELLIRKLNFVSAREALDESVHELENGEPVSGNPCGFIIPDGSTLSSSSPVGAQRRFLPLGERLRVLLSDKLSDVYVMHANYMDKFKRIDAIAAGSRILRRNIEATSQTNEKPANSTRKAGVLSWLQSAMSKSPVEVLPGVADHTKALETGQAALQLVGSNYPDGDTFRFNADHISRFSCAMLEASCGRTCQSFDTNCELCRVSFVINRYLEKMSVVLLQRMQLSEEIFGDRLTLEYETLFFEELHEPLFDFMLGIYTPTLNLIRLHASLVRPADLVSPADMEQYLPLFRALFYGLPPPTQPVSSTSTSTSASRIEGSKQPSLLQLFLQSASKLRHCRSPHRLAQELSSLVRSLMRAVEPHMPMMSADQLIMWLCLSISELASTSLFEAPASTQSQCADLRDSACSLTDNQADSIGEKHRSNDSEECQAHDYAGQDTQRGLQSSVSASASSSAVASRGSVRSISEDIGEEVGATVMAVLDSDSASTRTSATGLYASEVARDHECRKTAPSLARTTCAPAAASEAERLDALCSLYLSAQYLQHLLSSRERQSQASYCCTQLSGALFMLIDSLQNRIMTLNVKDKSTSTPSPTLHSDS